MILGRIVRRAGLAVFQAGAHVGQVVLARDRHRADAGLGVGVTLETLAFGVQRRDQAFDGFEQAQVGPRDVHARIGKRLVGQQDHRHLVLLGDVESADDLPEAVVDVERCHDATRRLAAGAVNSKLQIGLLGLGRQTGGRSAAHHIDDHQRALGHRREIQRLAHQRQARATGGGQYPLACERSTDPGRKGRNLVLELDRLTAELGQLLAQELEDRSGRSDGVARHELNPCRQRTEGRRFIAGHQDLIPFGVPFEAAL